MWVFLQPLYPRFLTHSLGCPRKLILAANRFPREYLVSTLHSNVVTIRASGDYSPTEENWRMGRQSLLAYAVGLLPFKDTFLTSDVRCLA